MEYGDRQVIFPVVLAAVCLRVQRVADDAVGPLHLVVVILVVCRTNDEARADAPDEGLEHLACELSVVIHHRHVQEPVGGPKAHVSMQSQSSAWELRVPFLIRGRHDSGSCRIPQRQRQASDPDHPYHPAAARLQWK